jgi:hypothetical protein
MDLLKTKPTRTVLNACLSLGLALGVAFFAAPAAAQEKKGNKNEKDYAPPQPVVMKYLGSQKARFQGHEALMIAGETAVGGKRVTLPVPNKDKYKYSPDEGMEDRIKGLQSGEYIVIETETKDYQTWLKKLDSYKMQAGEEQPNNFVFQDTYPRKEGDKEVVIVALLKFGNYIDAVLATKRDESSKQNVTDPDMAAAVGKFKKGDVVEVEIKPGNPPVIQSIDAFKPAEEAKMGKVVEADVAEGTKGPAVELDQNGKTVTLPIQGRMQGQKWVPDARLAGSIKGFKAGTAVVFRTREAGGKTYLKELKAAPKAPPPPKQQPDNMKPKGK